MTPPSALPVPRQVYCILSARALPYARDALSSLLARAREPLRLRLVTDGAEDEQALRQALVEIGVPDRHRVSVHAQAEIDDLAATAFQGLPHLQAFRHGHPCWRKITDPLVMAAEGEEMVILDPDLYFPNDFSFEPTPASGILLMWQPPSCLLPHEVVMRAYDEGFALAHHVDIGVGHARRNLDLAWLDHLVARLGGRELPRQMHVEAIVWAALAMREGGGYLPPEHWHCWQNRQWKRLALKLGVPGEALLAVDPFDRIKCFHGGGAAKWWVPGRVSSGRMPPASPVLQHLPPAPFEPLTRQAYLKTRRWKDLAARLGYYRLMA